MNRIVPSVSTFVTACALLATAACQTNIPLTPSAPGTSPTSGPDGSTLKASAPTLVSPVNSDSVLAARPTLVIADSKTQFANASLSYEFELMSDAGALIGRTTQSATSWAYPDNLLTGTAYRWRARAVLNGAAGPWSTVGRFLSARLTAPTVASTNDQWRVWFEQLRASLNVGPIMTAQALRILDPDLQAAGVIQETNSAGEPRGRLYLPTGSASNKFARSVDLGDFGGPWKWINVGATVCEGGSCK